MAGADENNHPDKLKVHDNGVIVVPPTVGKFAPGHPKGTFHMRASDYGGHHMELTPSAEDVWAEWKLDKNGVFGTPREYQFSMRLKTDCEYQDEESLQLSLRMGKGEPFLETIIAIPNTNGEWVETEPISMGEIGGTFKNTKFKILVPRVKGQVFSIREFIFTPPGADETGDYSGPWFTEWLEELKTKLIYKLPTLRSDAEAEALKIASKEYRQAVKEEHAATDKKAKEAQEKAKGKMETSYKDCFEAAKPLLGEIDKSSLATDDLALLQFLVLAQATPNTLAAYCYQGKEKVQRLMHLLKEDMELLKQFLVNGGAKRGFFGQALDIYHAIQEQQRQQEQQHVSDVLQRLALAVALELCDPIQEFDTTVVVDPMERYLHYEKAYLNGELDPAFGTFTVWELRNVVNCDAPNQQIQWCRDMLFNYRPDIAYMGEPLWRYSSIVKTDVKFGRPDWIRDQRDYYQMFARGGQCGIRAMCGRLVNKASGIPCVPVLQPSHGALAKWSPKGWHCVLGSDVGKCGDRSFFDFRYETNIRMSLGNDKYLLKVEILDWMAVLMNEKQTDSFPDPNCPWHTLALMQRKRLGETDETKEKEETKDCNVVSRIFEIRQREEPDKEDVIIEDDGTIVVPMSARDRDRAVVFMKSRDSGKQMNAKENWWVEYKLPADLVPVERTKYKLTMKICSIHDNDPKPFQWIVKSPHCSEKPIVEYTVPFPYTCGSWGETEPIEIELGGGEETMKVMRQKPCWPVTVKEFKLTPLL